MSETELLKIEGNMEDKSLNITENEDLKLLGITDEIAKEEQMCAEENEQETNQHMENMKRQAEEEKQQAEERHKMLMHLLYKSEFYSKFLLDKIEKQTNEAKNKKKGRKKLAKNDDKENQSKNTSESEESSSQSSAGSNKRKRESKTTQPAAKRKRNGNYAISEVIDKETVQEAASNFEENNNSTSDKEAVLDHPKYFENGAMRDYQLEGYTWLKVLFENGVNGILADEMGLGKTVQCIGMIAYLVQMQVNGPYLVIGPLSTLPNWVSEFQRFTPQIPVVLYHGNEATRKNKRAKIGTPVTVNGCQKKIYPVVITSFEVLMKDVKYLSQYYWRYLVVDEGHRLKNYKCKLVQCLKTVSSSNRLILTGTPLQNDLSELWSLMNFLLPEIFDSLSVFESWFNISDMMEDESDEKILQQERESQVLTTLHKILTPFFLRRTKADVAIDIPSKKELLVYTPMTELQLKLYTATINKDLVALGVTKPKEEEIIEYNDNGRAKRTAVKNGRNMKALLSESETPKAFEKFLEAAICANDEEELVKKANIPREMALSIKLQNPMMQLRKIVNHPYLLQYPLDKDGNIIINEDLVKKCGKLQVLDQLLKELKKRKHKVLIFSQMTMLLNIIEDYLFIRPQYQYRRLDGSVDLDGRREAIDAFNKDPNCFLFLVSTRAGSLGINLTAADTVIIYDSDWNPQQDLQAQDRCHRIGQTKPVLVLRLITSATIDERIVKRAAAKRKLEKMIMKSNNFKTNPKDKLEKVLDVDELKEMLLKRDYERIHRTETGNIFTQAELDQLLDRSDMVPSKANSNVKSTKSTKNPNKEVSGVFSILE